MTIPLDGCLEINQVILSWFFLYPSQTVQFLMKLNVELNILLKVATCGGPKMESKC